MTAPALNSSQIAVPGAPGAPGAVGAKVAAAAKAGGPAAVFDALMAALSPAAASTTPPATAIPETVDGEAAEDTIDVEATTADAAGLLAAAVALQSPEVVPAPPPAAAPAETPAGSAETAPPNSKGRPFALADVGHAPAHAGNDKSVPEIVDAEEDTAPPSGPVPRAETHAAKPAPPAYGRDKAAGVPAQPALDNANPKADLAVKASADAPDAPPAPAPAETPAIAAEAADAQIPAAQLARPEPVAGPAKPAKAAKTEAKASGPASDAASPVDVAGKAPQAKAAQAATAVGKAASDTVPAVEPKAGEAEADTDQPDASLPSDTRAASPSSAAAAHATHAVRGSPETVANLAAQILKKLEAKTTRFDVELDPAGLGRVDVRIEIGAHGKMTASMVFENPQAAHELKSRAAEMQRVLEQAGFDISGGLSFDVADQGRHQGQAWQDEAETGFGFRGQAFRAALETAGEADAAPTGALRLRRGVNAGVDVRI